MIPKTITSLSIEFAEELFLRPFTLRHSKGTVQFSFIVHFLLCFVTWAEFFFLQIGDFRVREIHLRGHFSSLIR